MNRNLITRMGTAGGVVAALVATVFAMLVIAVHDERSSTAAARRAERVVETQVQRLPALRSSAERARVTAGIAAAEATAQRRLQEAHDEAGQAIALGIGGLAGSALLIALLTTYLARRAVGLQQGDRRKDEFFALVTHELRTPLTSIIGYVEIVLDDEHELSPDARRFLQIVERNAKRLLRLVGDMLFVAQVDAGRLSLESGPVDLGAATADAVEAARPAAERAGVALTLEGTAGALVPGDRDRLAQMLDNLISNALKFTAAGGAVAVTLSGDDDRASIAVTDTGVGVPDSEQERLFERFFRATSATSGAVPGAGLGLTIVKAIAEAHGGSVQLHSRVGDGTTVVVELPITRDGSAER